MILKNKCIKKKEIKHEGVRYPFCKCEYAATTANDVNKHMESKHEV